MKKYNYLLLSAFVLTASLSACGNKSDKKQETTDAKKKVRVEVVSMQTVPQIAQFTATIQSESKNNIAPAMGGRIRKILVDVGAFVRAGQVVAVMDGTTLSQQQTQLATLKRDYERYKELYEVGGVSKQQLDQTKTQLEVAQAGINNLGENTSLRSPISGVVTARNYDPGDVAMQLPILTIENINPVKVVVNVSESYYTKVVKGMTAELKVEALGDETFQGKVSLIHPTLDAVAHTFPVEITVNNNAGKIRPGMYSRVVLNLGSSESVVVKDKAILKQSGTNDRYVFVLKDGKAVYTKIELGQRLDDKFEVLSGLHQGDQVIVEGNTNLVDATAVEVVK